MPTREEEIFTQARHLTDGERQAYLDRMCGDDEPLNRRLQQLLAAHDGDDAFLETSVADSLLKLAPPEHEAGETIDGYTLLRQIGDGTFGVVYVAEQVQPVRRRVALKVVKPGMDSTEVLARFEAERQTLALMEHPNISLILDGGTTRRGRPFFVMEFVDGISITEHCDRHRSTISERLQLFHTVCSAVEHAHQKGVIHRDLKPSNILVTMRDGVATPKVIDFGVAKVMASHVVDVMVSTHCAQLIGTPAYMSPEQAELSAVDVDTRSDVYSLGVLLYELLTGETSHRREQLQAAGFDEMRRIIREDSPEPPSRCINQLSVEELAAAADYRSTEPRHLQRAYRDELDWIVLKALRKERSARYQSAGALAADVTRFLNGDAVEAGPPTATYHLKKFARRHQRLLLTTAAFAVVLVCATATSLWLSFRATAAESRAEELRHAADQSADLARSRARQARQLLYSGDVRLAAEAFVRGDIARMRELLALHIPQDENPDNREFVWNYLWKQGGVEARQIAEYDHAIYFATASPDGRWFACCGADDQISLFDGTTFEELHRFATGHGEVNGLAFAHQSAQLASVGDDGHLVLWSLPECREIRRFRVHPNLAYQVRFSADDALVATCGNDPVIRVWDPLTGEQQQGLSQHTEKVECIDLSNEGWLVAGSRDHTASLWKLESGEHLWTDAGHQRGGIIGAAAFSPGEEFVVTGSGRGVLSVLQVSDPPSVQTRYRFPDGITAVAVSTDGTMAGVGDEGGQIHCMSVNLLPTQLQTGASESQFAGPDRIPQWRAHSGSVNSLIFSDDGMQVVSAGSDGRLIHWNRNPEHSLRRVYSQAGGFDFVGPETLVTIHKSLKFHDLGSGESTHETGTGLGQFNGIAVAGKSNQLFAATPTQVVSVVVDDQHDAVVRYRSQAEGEEVRLIAVSPNGSFLAVFSHDSRTRNHSLRLINTATDGSDRVVDCDSINAMAFHPQGTMLAYCQNNDICLLDVGQCRLVDRLIGHLDSLQSVEFSSDGRFLASGADDRTIRVWDVQQRTQVWTTTAHHNSVRSVDFSPDGRTIVSGGDDESLRLWNWQAGRMLCELPTGFSQVVHVGFSPNGDFVAMRSHSSVISVISGSPSYH